MGDDDKTYKSSRFSTHADALLRKNLTFQKRNANENLRIVCFPIIVCVLLYTLQTIVDHQTNKYRCGCKCVVPNKTDGSCAKEHCSILHSTLKEAFTCEVPRPIEWPPLFQVPHPSHRAVSTGPGSVNGLPKTNCRRKGSCPSALLLTGSNSSFGKSLSQNFFPANYSLAINESNISNISHAVKNLLDSALLGTYTPMRQMHFLEPGFFTYKPIYNLASHCSSSINKKINDQTIKLQCLQGLNLWMKSSSDINEQLFKGYGKSKSDGSGNQYMSAYDFLNSDMNKFNVRIWYNSTYRKGYRWPFIPSLVRVGLPINMVSNAYLKLKMGSDAKMIKFKFIKEMPKPATSLRLDLASLMGPFFITLLVGLLLPVLSTYLVYEKEHNLRIMMKIHGLQDGPYWTISYAYFLVISLLYITSLATFGSLIDLKFFILNDYGVQFVFFFAYMNLQIALAFIMASVFSNVKISQAIIYIYVIGFGILAECLFKSCLENSSFPRKWILVMELIPSFSLYRGLYELSWFSFNGVYTGTSGIKWDDLKTSESGLREVIIIIVAEWCLFLPPAYYLSTRRRISNKLQEKIESSFQRQGSKRKVCVEDFDKPDVIQERDVVEQLLSTPDRINSMIRNFVIVSNNLTKVFPQCDGNPAKFAVNSLSLAVQRGECFGILGPNGAGKTSFISMMTGLLAPTSGSGYVNGYSIETDMDKIYPTMGVCPQHDMLWETLTGREHLLFYGRLKNMKGSSLLRAVEDSLESVELNRFGDKKVGKYSGGMKRRLSVAISLIGDPKVVYMDEPSTGLDPGSRNNLWSVIKSAKQKRAIILTTEGEIWRELHIHNDNKLDWK